MLIFLYVFWINIIIYKLYTLNYYNKFPKKVQNIFIYYTLNNTLILIIYNNKLIIKLLN